MWYLGPQFRSPRLKKYTHRSWPLSVVTVLPLNLAPLQTTNKPPLFLFINICHGELGVVYSSCLSSKGTCDGVIVKPSPSDHKNQTHSERESKTKLKT